MARKRLIPVIKSREPLKKGAKQYRPRSGLNTIRILPPTWRYNTHWGYDVKHRNRLRIAVYVIDRKAKRPEPRIWLMPWSFDYELAHTCILPRNKVILPDHPDEGYNVSFVMKGRGSTRRYGSIKLWRRKTRLLHDAKKMNALLDYVLDNPVPAQLRLSPPYKKKRNK